MAPATRRKALDKQIANLIRQDESLYELFTLITTRRTGACPKKAIAVYVVSYICLLLIARATRAVHFNEPTCKALYERGYKRSGIKMNRSAEAKRAYVAVQKRLLLMATPYGVTRTRMTLST